MEKRILITGGAGYLGTVLTKKLLDKGYKVRVLDSLLHGKEPIKKFINNPNYEIIVKEVRNLDAIQSSLVNVDGVIHLAGVVGDPASAVDPDATIAINYFSTISLAEACKFYGIKRFVFASTCSVYGFGENIFTEESKENPVSLYAKSKLYSEKALIKMSDKNFCPTILRKATIYGLSYRMRFDLVTNLLTAQAIGEKQITIFGGQQWRPLLHVADAAEIYLKCIEKPIEKIGGQILNCGDDRENYTILQIGELIKNEVPDAEIKIFNDIIDKRSYRVSFSKIKKLLNFKANFSVKYGIKEIVDGFNNGRFTNYRDKKYNNFLKDEEKYYRYILKYDSPDKF